MPPKCDKFSCKAQHQAMQMDRRTVQICEKAVLLTASSSKALASKNHFFV